MEKTLTIDNKQVKFKTNGGLIRRYRHQFGRDFFQDLGKMAVIEGLEDGEELSPELLQAIDFEVFENITWMLAKIADPDIPDVLEWMEAFDEFPIVDILPEIMDMIAVSLQGKKKEQENHPATR